MSHKDLFSPPPGAGRPSPPPPPPPSPSSASDSDSESGQVSRWHRVRQVGAVGAALTLLGGGTYLAARQLGFVGQLREDAQAAAQSKDIVVMAEGGDEDDDEGQEDDEGPGAYEELQKKYGTPEKSEAFTTAVRQVLLFKAIGLLAEMEQVTARIKNELAFGHELTKSLVYAQNWQKQFGALLKEKIKDQAFANVFARFKEETAFAAEWEDSPAPEENKDETGGLARALARLPRSGAPGQIFLFSEGKAFEESSKEKLKHNLTATSWYASTEQYFRNLESSSSSKKGGGGGGGGLDTRSSEQRALLRYLARLENLALGAMAMLEAPEELTARHTLLVEFFEANRDVFASRTTPWNKMAADVLQAYERPYPLPEDRSSYVLYGPSGVGKTFLATTIANFMRLTCMVLGTETGVRKYMTNDFQSAYLGESEKRLLAVLRDHREDVFFVDEAQNLGSDTERAGTAKKLLALMMNYLSDRPRGLVGVLAGYQDEFEEFVLKVEKGLRRRFRFIDVLPYSRENLLLILLERLAKAQPPLPVNKLALMLLRELVAIPALFRTSAGAVLTLAGLLRSEARRTGAVNSLVARRAVKAFSRETTRLDLLRSTAEELVQADHSRLRAEDPFARDLAKKRKARAARRLYELSVTRAALGNVQRLLRAATLSVDELKKVSEPWVAEKGKEPPSRVMVLKKTLSVMLKLGVKAQMKTTELFQAGDSSYFVVGQLQGDVNNFREAGLKDLRQRAPVPRETRYIGDAPQRTPQRPEDVERTNAKLKALEEKLGRREEQEEKECPADCYLDLRFGSGSGSGSGKAPKRLGFSLCLEPGLWARFKVRGATVGRQGTPATPSGS